MKLLSDTPASTFGILRSHRVRDVRCLRKSRRRGTYRDYSALSLMSGYLYKHTSHIRGRTWQHACAVAVVCTVVATAVTALSAWLCLRQSGTYLFRHTKRSLHSHLPAGAMLLLMKSRGGVFTSTGTSHSSCLHGSSHNNLSLRR